MYLPLNAYWCPKQARNIVELEALPRDEISAWTKSQATNFIQVDLAWKIILAVAVLSVFVALFGLFLVFKKVEPAATAKYTHKLSILIFFNPIIRFALAAYIEASMVGVSALLPTYDKIFGYANYDEERRKGITA